MDTAHWSTYNLIDFQIQTLTLLRKVISGEIDKETADREAELIRKKLETLSDWIDSEARTWRL